MGLDLRLPTGVTRLGLESQCQARQICKDTRDCCWRNSVNSCLSRETRRPGAGRRRLGGDLIDQANADAEAELQIRLHQTYGHLLRAIEEALGRIREGTSGVCLVCKQPISKARLEAVPWTHLCSECKEGGAQPLSVERKDRQSLEVLNIKAGTAHGT
jgi:RNA polymerase-binding transcription factor DksA